MKKIIIVDYKLGNLFSVNRALIEIGLNPIISSSPEDIENADALILPGVGAFNNAMINLNELKLTEPIKQFVNSGKPFFGICLGLQLLFTESEEFQNTQGLNIISGKVLKFSNQNTNKERLKVPQIGWNQIIRSSERNWENTPLSGISENENMYFVHSYYVSPVESNVSLSFSEYGGYTYTSSVLKENIFACQFHPEKSSKEGLKIYNNWARLNELLN
jgi:glutamine amidotransferase